MRIKMLQEYNTPHRYIAQGEVVDWPSKEAKAAIASGLAKAAKAGDEDAADGS